MPVVASTHVCNTSSESDDGISFSSYDFTPNAQEHCKYEFSASAKEKCLKEEYPKLLKLYQEGKCSKLLTKKYTIDGCDCELQYLENGTTYSTGCHSTGKTLCNMSSAMEKLKNMANK